MKNRFNIKILLATFVLSTCAIMVGCDDNDSLPQADALFRPIVNETSIGGQWIELAWDRYEGSNSYELLLTGKDGLELTASTDTTFYKFEDLSYDTDYVIKIRALNKTNGLMSQYFVVPTITTTDIVTDLKDVQTIDNQALISWGNDASYNLLKIFHITTPTGSTETTEEVIQEIPVDPQELAEGKIIIKGLEAKNNYIVRAYNNTTYLGKKKFSTAAPEQYDGKVVDLRSYNAEDSYGLITQAWLDGIVSENPDQNITIVMQGGTTYELGSLLIPATTGSIKFVTGLSLNGMASFAVKGSLAVKDGATVGGFIAEKIFFTDHPSTPKNAANFGGNYLFNFNKSGSALGKLSLINCTIKYKRGLCRIQTKAAIDEFIMNNCVVDSIGGYGITNADSGDADIKKIKLSNSTFSHCEKMFVSTKPNSKSIDSFSAEKCTFVYNMKSGNNYIFDFDKMVFGTDPSIKDCLFGPAGNDGKAVACSGFRAGKGSLVVTNSYSTSDITWYSADGSTPTAPIDLIKAKTDVNGTFEDAQTSNFKLKNNELANIGDPRWK